VLLSGAARLVLLAVAVMMLLAPWGVESGDIFSGLRSGIFGITVGGVTLSIGTMLMAVALFLVGIVLTRTLQGWLQKRYLPKTQLDAGLKNSITTGFGYFGVVVAGALSVSYLGIGFDRITIVAGALSVGIGFGLQSIVNNFVSGLILLAERGIRVGDLVNVGGEEGYVRRINVRATQIETFDRATLIVPNSNLVSGTVKNWVHADRISRVVVNVPLGRDTDADAVASLLREVAENHPDVLEDPPPRVLFKKNRGRRSQFRPRLLRRGRGHRRARVQRSHLRRLPPAAVAQDHRPGRTARHGDRRHGRAEAAGRGAAPGCLGDGRRRPARRLRHHSERQAGMTASHGLSFRTVALAFALGGLLAACSPEPPAATQPSFYQRLDEGASLDQATALSMINGHRARSGLPALTLDPVLSQEARARAASVAETDTSTWGETPAVGASASSVQRLERVSAGYRTFAEAFSGWRDSPSTTRSCSRPPAAASASPRWTGQAPSTACTGD